MLVEVSRPGMKVSFISESSLTKETFACGETSAMTYALSAFTASFAFVPNTNASTAPAITYSITP